MGFMGMFNLVNHITEAGIPLLTKTFNNPLYQLSILIRWAKIPAFRILYTILIQLPGQGQIA